MSLRLRAQELLPRAGASSIAMPFSTPLSAPSDQVGRVRLIVAGWLAYGLFYLGMGLLPPGAPLALYGLFAFYGVFTAAPEGGQKALVADLVPPQLRGVALGWFNLTAGLMRLQASLLLGALHQGAGALAAFAVSAACALMAALLLVTWALRRTQPA
jgi:sugar phosphate permease